MSVAGAKYLDGEEIIVIILELARVAWVHIEWMRISKDNICWGSIGGRMKAWLVKLLPMDPLSVHP